MAYYFWDSTLAKACGLARRGETHRSAAYRGELGTISTLSGLVKTFNQTRQMMKAFSGMGAMGRMKALKQMGNMDMFSGKMPTMKVRQRSVRKKVDRRKLRKKHSR